MMKAGPPEEPERKLAAILAADVVGFSRMMRADEAGTLARWDAARRDVIDPVVSAHRGRIFKVMGDGLLAEFASVVLALRAAIAIQTGLPAHAGDTPPDQRIVLRIGVHQGDVLVQGTDLLGDGVNIAARLETLAPGGGICISARVREDAAGKIALTVEDGGERALRNIAQPMRVFFLSPSQPPPEPAVPMLPGLVRPRLAILPFTGLGGEEARSLAADLSAALPEALSQWPGLVAALARPTGLPSPAATTDVLDAAATLGAPYVLQGAVRQDGQTVQLAVRVLDVATGKLLWGGQQATALDGLEAFRSRLPGQLAKAVGLRLPVAGPASRDAEEHPGERTMVVAPARSVHRLVILQSTAPGPAPGHAVLLAGARLVIGRQAPSDLILPGGEVSRTHCQLDVTGHVVTVTDLRSTNGTFVNDERIVQPTQLVPGATLKVGLHLMRYVKEAAAAELDPEATLVERR